MKHHTLFLLVALLGVTLVSAGFFSVNTTTNKIVDDQGRERIFHGVNAVNRHFPYIPYIDTFDPCMSLSEQDFINMKAWGLNGMRLGTMWPGVESSRGVYNETYLANLKWIVDTAGKHGIYSLLDMHQDQFSEKFCGDGMPLWLISDIEYEYFPSPLKEKVHYDNETGLPIDCQHSIDSGVYYATWDVAEGFEKLYINFNGKLDMLAQFWGKVASTFIGNPYILGYELINEPFAGNFYKNPLLMVPGVAEKIHLQGVYDRIAEEIRKYDEDHIIFFEGVTWDNMVPVGFSHPPGGEQYANRSTLAYHYYSPPDFAMELYFEQRGRDAKRLNIASFLTEFYASGGSDEWINKAMDMCDKHNQSWLAWMYKAYAGFCDPSSPDLNGGFYYNNGTEIYHLVHNLVRTYAPAVAGSTVKTLFNSTTGEYELQYKMCTSCGQTEIIYNTEHYYPNGFQITLGGNAHYTASNGQVLVTPIKASKEHELITVKLIPTLSLSE